LHKTVRIQSHFWERETGLLDSGEGKSRTKKGSRVLKNSYSRGSFCCDFSGGHSHPVVQRSVPFAVHGTARQSHLQYMGVPFTVHGTVRQSYLQYMGLRRALLTFASIELVFKATDPDGLILYNGYATDGTGDFISVALRNGTLEYRFDLGTGPAIIRYIHTGAALPEK